MPRGHWLFQRRETCSPSPPRGQLRVEDRRRLRGTSGSVPASLMLRALAQKGLGSNPPREKLSRWLHFLRLWVPFHFFILCFIQYFIECLLRTRSRAGNWRYSREQDGQAAHQVCETDSKRTNIEHIVINAK